MTASATETSPRRWLVTGAGGQVGRSFCALPSPARLEVVPLTRADLDVTDAAAVARALERVQPDAVLNCAAYTDVDGCETAEEAARRVNGEAPGLLGKACAGAALLVHLSTEYVFAGRGSEPIPEDASPDPLSAYGRTKLTGEEGVRASGCEHLIVRSQWLFGPGPNFARTIGRAALEGRTLRVVDDQRGRPTWTYPLARAVRAAVDRGARGLLHLACDGETSWFGFARAIVDEGVRRGWHEPVEVEPVRTREFPRPAPRPAHAVLGLERAHALGLRPPHWRQALAGYLDSNHGYPRWPERSEAEPGEAFDG